MYEKKNNKIDCMNNYLAVWEIKMQQKIAPISIKANFN